MATWERQFRFKRASPKANKSDEENQDPFSPNHPINKAATPTIQMHNVQNGKQYKKRNNKTKDEWDYFRRSSKSTKPYKLNIQWNDTKYNPLEASFNYLELKTAECDNIKNKNNKKIEVYLCVINDNQPIIDINLYQIKCFLIEPNIITIFAPLHSLIIHNRAQSEEIKTYHVDDGDLIVNLDTNDTLTDFYRFVEHIHQRKPSKECISSSYKALNQNNSDCTQSEDEVTKKQKQKSWHRNTLNASGHTPTLPNGKSKKKKISPSAIDNPDARDKHQYSHCLDSKHSHHRSVGNGSAKKRAKMMQKAATDPKVMAAQKAQQRMMSIERKREFTTEQRRNMQIEAGKEKKQCKNTNYTKSGKQIGNLMRRKISGRNIYKSRHKKDGNGNKSGKLGKYPSVRAKMRGNFANDNVSRKYASQRLSDIYSSGRSGECVGFKNLGNTCFLNAILRSITNLKCFSFDMRRKYMVYTMGECYSLYRAYLELLFGDIDNAKAMQCGGGRKMVLDPWILKKIIGQKDKMFADNRQQDAHELLSFLLNAFHDEIYKAILKQYGHANESKKSDSMNGKQEADNDDDVDMEKDDKDRRMDVDEEDDEAAGGLSKEELEWLSPIHSNFHFQIEFKFECTKCKYTRNKIESFREMSLDLPLIKMQKQKQQKEETNEIEKHKEQSEETKGLCAFLLCVFDKNVNDLLCVP